MSWHSIAIHRIHRQRHRMQGVYGIGYNSDMRKETPDACLCSVIWNWSAYYTSEVQSIIDGTYDGKNYYGGMADGLVDITDLADFCADGTQEKVDEARAEILSGKCNVFDGKIETNTGDTIGKKGKTLDDDTITGGINWYYKKREDCRVGEIRMEETNKKTDKI